MLKTSKDRHLIESYTSGWKGGAKDKLKPEQQLREAYAKVAAMKDRLRQLLRKAATTNQHHAKVPANTSIEDTACSVCGSAESWADNDLLLCDGPGCERAYHQHCMEPHMSRDERDDVTGDTWLCRQCECLDKCLGLVNQQLGTNYVEVEGLFPELDRADGGEVWSSAEEDDDSDFEDQDSEEEEEEDEEEESGSDEGSDDEGSDEEEEGSKAGGEIEEREAAEQQVGEEDDSKEEEDDDEEDGSSDEDSEDEEDSDEEDGEGGGSASGDEIGSCASVFSVDDSELQELAEDAQAELEEAEDEDGGGARLRRRPRRSAASACKKRIDEVLGLRAKAGKGVRRERADEEDDGWEPPQPVAVELNDPVARIAKVLDLETNKMEHRLVAGMIVSSDDGEFFVFYEDDQEFTLKVRRGRRTLLAVAHH